MRPHYHGNNTDCLLTILLFWQCQEEYYVCDRLHYNHRENESEEPMNVSDAIRLKRAVRKFQDKPLPDDVVHAILNAGRRAQSSKNTQAWRFIAIRDRETLKALSQCGEWAGHIAGAALCVAILTPDPTEKFQIMFDAGQAADCKDKAEISHTI
jgi:hypothetical protein